MTMPVLLDPSEHFPDLEDVLCDLLIEWYDFEEEQVGSETPDDLQEHFPYVRVELIAGTDDQITDRGAYDVEVFAATREDAYNLSEDIRQRLLRYPHRVGDVVIDNVYTEQKPQRLPWDVETTRRFGATYRISARR